MFQCINGITYYVCFMGGEIILSLFLMHWGRLNSNELPCVIVSIGIKK